MRYVLDTNVVSMLRVRGRHPAVETWAPTVAAGDLFVTATSIAEIERGVSSEERSDPQQGVTPRRWFDDHVIPTFDGRILPFDLRAARILATYRVPEHAPLDDALIAAVAQAGGMTVVTRNVKHFEPLGSRASIRGPDSPSPYRPENYPRSSTTPGVTRAPGRAGTADSLVCTRADLTIATPILAAMIGVVHGIRAALRRAALGVGMLGTVRQTL